MRWPWLSKALATLRWPVAIATLNSSILTMRPRRPAAASLSTASTRRRWLSRRRVARTSRRSSKCCSVRCRRSSTCCSKRLEASEMLHSAAIRRSRTALPLSSMQAWIRSCPCPNMFHILCKSYCTPKSSFLLAEPGAIRKRPSMNSSTETVPLSLKSMSMKSSFTSKVAICSRLISFLTSFSVDTPRSNSSSVSIRSPSSSMMRKSASRRRTTLARSLASFSVRFFGRMSIMLSTMTAVTKLRSARLVKRMKAMMQTATAAPGTPLCMRWRTALGKSSRVAKVKSVNIESERLPKRRVVTVSS
mmetsp:Transcript_124455/g.265250  ORF Transcript_124455/g.265250 Transcript_124455/m.265250 type:complete len:304 (-) Transcript_124455:707-1618(-)